MQLKFILFFIQCIYKSDNDQIYLPPRSIVNPNENIFKSCAIILNIISNTASYSVYRVMYTGCHVPAS